MGCRVSRTFPMSPFFASRRLESQPPSLENPMFIIACYLDLGIRVRSDRGGGNLGWGILRQFGIKRGSLSICLLLVIEDSPLLLIIRWSISLLGWLRLHLFLLS